MWSGRFRRPLLTQWVANRAKRQEFEFETQRRQEDRHEDNRRSVLQERRTIYVQLSTAASQYEQAIYEYLWVISEGRPLLSNGPNSWRRSKPSGDSIPMPR